MFDVFGTVSVVLVMFLAASAMGDCSGLEDEPLTVSVPLDAYGTLSIDELVEGLSKATGLEPPARDPSLMLSTRGEGSSRVLQALESTLAPGVKIEPKADSLVLAIDRSNLVPAQRADWSSRLAKLGQSIERDETLAPFLHGLRALSSYRPNDAERPTVLLVHGMNSNSGCFIHMVPPLHRAGYGVVVYDYPDHQALDHSALDLAHDLAAFRARWKEERPWSFVCHSMGGLVARSYVEGEDYRGDVSDLVLIGTPNQGAAVARAQTLVRLLRDLRLRSNPGTSIASALTEGGGDAARDILPNSLFLRRLNSASRRAGVRYHLLAGNEGWIDQADRRELEHQLDEATRAGGVFGKLARLATSDLPSQLDALTNGTGDGVVTVESTRLAGVEPATVIAANHVALIRAPLFFADPGPVACLPWLIDQLPPPAP